MTAIESTAPSDSLKPAGPVDPTKAAHAGFFTTLLDAVARPVSLPGGKAVEIGRLGAPDAPAKRKKPAASSADTLTPTNIAVTELATRGTPRATVLAAEAEQVNAGSRTGATPRKPTASPQSGTEPHNSDASHAPRSENQSLDKARATTDPRSSSTPSNADPVQNPAPHPGRASTLVSMRGTPAIPGNVAAISRLLQASSPHGFDRGQAANSRAIVRPAFALHAQGKAWGGEARGASKAPAPPRPQTPESEFAMQLGRGFAAIMRQGGGSLTLRLEPEALGEMTIRMELQPGKVAAEFEVKSDQARQLLDANLSALRSALEARGLSVDGLTVHVTEPPQAGGGSGEPPMQDASAHDRSEPGPDPGGAEHPEGGAPGEQGGSGTDRPTADGARAPARSASLPEAGAPGPVQGGAQVVHLVLDAVA